MKKEIQLNYPKLFLQSFTIQNLKTYFSIRKRYFRITVVDDLSKMPHLLVAGTTGSGKSVAVNAMILSFLYKATAEEVRMIFIDPKMLELSVYEGIPHLLCPVITDMRDASKALNWCVQEMDYRYRLMSTLGVRSIASYNQKISQSISAVKEYLIHFQITRVLVMKMMTFLNRSH